MGERESVDGKLNDLNRSKVTDPERSRVVKRFLINCTSGERFSRRIFNSGRRESEESIRWSVYECACERACGRVWERTRVCEKRERWGLDSKSYENVDQNDHIYQVLHLPQRTN